MTITGAVHCEIVSTLATLMMVHTMYPTPEQYTTVCQKLVGEYKILHDGFGCGYVSSLALLTQFYAIPLYCFLCIQATWRQKLIFKFQNGRNKRGKRQKRNLQNGLKEDLQTSEEYNSAVSQLKKEFTQKKVPKAKTVKKLLDDTFATQRMWIVRDQPHISEKVEKFQFMQ